MEPFRLIDVPGRPAGLHIKRWEREYPGLSVGFTTRIGGVSRGDYHSLNCALHVRDHPQHVVENRRRLADVLHISFDAWTCGEQVHDRRVAIVARDSRGKGRLSQEDAIPATDALLTNEPDIWLTSFYADCVPLYFFDPARRVVGLAHAGWKGTVLQIARHTIEAMEREYGSRRADVLAAVGPSIAVCCYEVDGRVISRVDECLAEIGADEAERKSVYVPKADGKAMLSLQHLNRQIMIKAGILPTHIEMCEMCTGCRTDLFFSHRKEGGSTGRMASWISLAL